MAFRLAFKSSKTFSSLMQKPNCPKCGSKDLIDDMETIYGMWGELVGTEEVKRCRRCGETFRKDRKYESDTT